MTLGGREKGKEETEGRRGQSKREQEPQRKGAGRKGARECGGGGGGGGRRLADSGQEGEI